MVFTSRILLFGLALTCWLPAHARLSTAWLEAPAHAPNVMVFIHQNSVKDGKPSTVSIQRHKISDAKVARLLDHAKSSGWRRDDLGRENCYLIKKSGLSTRQTWCAKKNGEVFAFVELGLRRMSENQLDELILQHLEARD